jgi:hypothetical protein
MDAQDLTEHGGNIGGAWLSEKEELVLAMLNDAALCDGWDSDPETVECDAEPPIDAMLS